jgi:hypothetical protein
MNTKRFFALTIFLFGNMIVFSGVISDLIKDHSASQLLIRGGLMAVFFILSMGMAFLVLKVFKFSSR